MPETTRAFFLASLVFAVSLSIPRVVFPAQVELRVVHVLSHLDCPTRIRALSVGEAAIEPDKPFSAGEDWLKSLSWEIENTREKSVAGVEIDLDFHGLARGNSVYKYQFLQGTDRPGDQNETELLRPGQRMKMIVSDEEYGRIERFIAERQSNLTTSVIISVVEMTITRVLFEDGTVWPDEKPKGL